MIRHMYVSHKKRWVGISLRYLTGDWLRRVEECFTCFNGTESKTSVLRSYTSLDSPVEVVNSFFETCPAAAEQLVAYEDKGLLSCYHSTYRSEACATHTDPGFRLRGLVQEGRLYL